MKFSDEFGGKYFKASDFPKPRLLTITRFEREAMMGNVQDLKWVVYFEEDRRGLVLNQTNADTIRTLYGDDSSQCIGKQLVLFQANTEMQGRTVPCIRVRGPKRPAAPPPEPEPEVDEIPF